MLTTCVSDETFGPGRVVRSQFNIGGLFQVGGTLPITPDTVIIELRRFRDSSLAAVDTITGAGLNSRNDSLLVRVDVKLNEATERFYFRAEVRAGGVLYYTVSGQVQVRAGETHTTQPMTPTYVGPGSLATSLVMSLVDSTIQGGDSVLLSAVVLQNSTVLTGVPVGYVSSDTVKVRTRAVGLNQAWAIATANQTDSVTITAVTGNRLQAAGKLHFFARAAQLLLVSGDGQTVPAGSPAAQPLVVQVRDSAGNPQAGYLVRFAVTAGPQGTTVVPDSTMTDAQGYAQTALLAGVAAGPVTVTASVVGVAPVTFTATVTAVVPPTTWDAAADFSATSNPNGEWSSGWTGTLGSAFTLYPQTNGSTTLPGWVDSSIINAGTPGFAKNVSGGVLFGVNPGQVALHGGCNNGEYSVLRWQAPTTGSYLVNAQFFAGDAGNTDAYVLQNGNGAAPLFSAASTGSSPTFGSAVSLTANETLDFVVGLGGDGCLFDTTPIDVVITAGGPTSVAPLSSQTQSAVVNQPVTSVPSVLVRDANNGPVAGVTVTFAITSGGGSATGTSQVTGLNGIATVGSWTVGQTVGANTMTATVSGLAPVVFTANSNPDVADTVVLISGDNQTANAGAPLPSPLVIEVRDQFGNVVPGATVAWAAVTGGGSLNPTSTQTTASGRAQSDWTLGSGSTSQTATATVGSLTPVTFNATATFQAPAILLSFTGLPGIGVGLSTTVDVVLSTPAGAGGVTVNLSSQNTGVVTVQSPSVVIPQGQTSGTVTINGVAVGTTTITGQATGYTDGVLSVTVQDRSISLPVTINVPYGQTASLPIQIADTALAGGVDLDVVSSAPGFVGVQVSPVHINQGFKTANATLIGVLPGPATITVSNPSYTSATSAATTTASLNILQSSAAINGSFGLPITIQFESNGSGIAAPAPGIAVSLTSNNVACAVASPTQATIQTGLVTTTSSVVYGGSAQLPCTTYVLATATNLQPDSILVTVNPIPAISLTVNSAVGGGLQENGSINLGASNHGGVILTLKSSNPALALVSASGSVAGADSIDISVQNGTQFVGFVVQAVEGQTGTATIAASAPGFTTGSVAATIVPPALDLQGLPTTTTTLSPDNAIYARVGLDDAQHNFLVRLQNVRAGAPAPLQVTFVNDTAGVGTLVTLADTADIETAQIPEQTSNSPTAVAFGGVGFHPLASGTTTVRASIPGFVSTAQATRAIAVAQPAISVNINSAVGAGLQESGQINLGASQHGGVTVTLKSSNPGVALVSASGSTAGADSIDVPVLNGTQFFNYVVQAIEGQTGSATITVSAPGFAAGTTTATVVQPALDLQNVPPTTTTLSPNNPIYARVGIDDAQHNFLVRLQNVRAGAPAPLQVTMVSGTPAVGTLVSQAGGTNPTQTAQIPVLSSNTPTSLATGGVEFHPVLAGSTDLSATIPGFVATGQANRTITVSQPGITVNVNSAVGSGLQESGQIVLGASQHGGVTVTVKSSNPGVALVSPAFATAGVDSFDVSVPNGTQLVGYYVHGLEGQTGAVTVTVSAPGFTNGTTVATIVPPAIDLQGLPTTTTTLSGNNPIYARIGIDDPQHNFLVRLQNVRAGAPAPLQVTMVSGAPAVGTLVSQAAGTNPSQTVQIPALSSNTPTSLATGGVEFQPLTAGTTTVRTTSPGVISTGQSTRSVDVSVPAISVTVNSDVGAGLQEGGLINLGAAQHGGATVTVTSSNPSLVLVSSSPSSQGANTVDITVPNGTQFIAYTMQALEGRTGTATITVSSPGFTSGNVTARVVQPALDVQALPSSVGATSPDVPFYVRVGIANSLNTALQRLQNVRAGSAGVQVQVSSSATSAGTLVTLAGGVGSPQTVAVPEQVSNSPTTVSTGGVAFRPVAPGFTTVSATSTGYVVIPTASIGVTVN